MAAGADSIDDMDLLRHGAMPELFNGVRVPSTLGSFLRSFTWGNVRQLAAAGRSCSRSWQGWRRCCPARTSWRSNRTSRRIVSGKKNAPAETPRSRSTHRTHGK
jgi:hypothetical protein